MSTDHSVQDSQRILTERKYVVELHVIFMYLMHFLYLSTSEML